MKLVRQIPWVFGLATQKVTVVQANGNHNGKDCKFYAIQLIIMLQVKMEM